MDFINKLKLLVYSILLMRQKELFLNDIGTNK
jgi:hypothetical protein